MKILAAEDNALLARLLAKTVQSLGWSCDIAKNGSEAIDMVAKDKYDVVLLDINMPGVNGYEAASWMNTNIPKEERPRIIALTGAQEDDTDALCAQHGFDAWLDKPVMAETLKNLLEG